MPDPEGSVVVAVLAGDTWGIPGPTFIVFYVALGAVAIAGTLLVRRLMFRGRTVRRDLHLYELAYLAGGERQVLATALTGLRAEGAVTVSRERLRLTAAEPAGRGELDWAILRAIPAYEIDRATDLLRSPDVCRALRAIADGLVRDGLVRPADGRSRWTLATFPLWAVVALGVVRLIAGIGAGKPVNYLIAALVLMTVTALLLTLAYPLTTRAGRELLAEQTERYRHLDPEVSPAWDTYGPEGAALAAALFGAGALVSIDPAYAKTMAFGDKLAKMSNMAGGSRYGGAGYTGGGIGGGSCGGGGGGGGSGGSGGGSGGGGGGCGG
jgi:uncharacterized protein (TIGR04222 family)